MDRVDGKGVQGVQGVQDVEPLDEAGEIEARKIEAREIEPKEASGRAPGRVGIGRRGFLQAGLAGVAATVASSAMLPASAAAADQTAGETVGQTEADYPRTCDGTDPCPPTTEVREKVLAEAAAGKIDPATAFETWNEPWVWRPSNWPGQQLDLHVVENQNRGIEVGLGNPGSVIFSYGGNTPGPTIRMRGDEILYVKLRNLLGEDSGRNITGPNPDPNELTPELDAEVCRTAGVPYDPKTGTCSVPSEDCGQKTVNQVGAGKLPEAVAKVIGKKLEDDFCLGEHINGLHATHVTNLHTHGLHVRPDRNPNGTHSDNVILRVMPQADLIRREQNATEPSCDFLRKPAEIYFLRDDETAGEADYEFRLGDVMGDPNQPHPPGTHWYHPHAHGATQNQVSSGMAGFLIVEGDVDESVNQALTGRPDPEPTEKTGPFDYRERLMFMQRVFPGNVSVDPDANPRSPQLMKQAPLPLVNGSDHPAVITMRPGAVERWRIINGSVDGRAYKRFMVVKGQYDLVTVDPSQPTGDRLFYIDPDTGEARVASYQELEDCKQQLFLLARDGITLVEKTRDGSRYFVEDLAKVKAGANPIARCLDPEDPNRSMLENIDAAFRDARSIKNTFVRPNEVYMTAANRADVFFRAPRQGEDECRIYTVLAKAVVVHSDNPVQTLQKAVAAGNTTQGFGPADIVVAHIVVKGKPIREEVDLEALPLPPVPPYLRPIDDHELHPTPAEVETKKIAPDSFRTRTVTYSGWGSQDFPLVEVPDRFVKSHPELRNLFYAPTGKEEQNVLMPPAIRTMAIDGRKFSPDDPKRPRVFVLINEENDVREGKDVHAAEEWVLYNTSSMLWGNTSSNPDGTSDDPRSPDYRQPSFQYKGHYVSYPLTRAEGNRIFWQNHHFQVTARAVDHPFHIHQNPFWVLRIEIPDADGNLVNILDKPRWQDAIWIPRNGGRVVFRSRFPDFVGTWVNHCHLLLHEDNGMMQPVQGTPFADEANYVARDRVADGEMSAAEVDRIYGPSPTPEDSYRQNVEFYEPTPAWSEQPEYPGFPVEPPKLPET